MTAGLAASALSPVAERLRRDAEAQADRIRAAARTEAAAILAQARRQEAAIIAAANVAATTRAAPLTAAMVGNAHDTARSAVLSAQREAYDTLHTRLRAAVAALPGQPGYDRLGRRIARLAAQAAGPDARLSPEPGGGFVARSPGVIVDCSLGRLADLAVSELGPAITELWTTP
jgi:vacuolar-type H+-ATPase subunit E/Vma4